MIGKQEIVEVNFACLIVTDEIAVCAVNRVEGEARKIHCHEIEVHTLDAESGIKYLFCLKFS